MLILALIVDGLMVKLFNFFLCWSRHYSCSLLHTLRHNSFFKFNYCFFIRKFTLNTTNSSLFIGCLNENVECVCIVKSSLDCIYITYIKLHQQGPYLELVQIISVLNTAVRLIFGFSEYNIDVV